MCKINRGIFLFLFCILCLDAHSQSLRLIVVPDTQSALESCPEIMESQFKWMGEQAGNFDYMLHVGDVTQSNTPAEWALAWIYFQPILDKIPFAISLGNHDFGSGRDKYADNRDSHLANKYFPLEKLKQHNPLQGEFEEGKMDNTYHIFQNAGESWLILALEFGPRNEVLDWANEVVKNHSDHKVILVTHAYMYVGDKRLGKEDEWSPHNYGIGEMTGKEAPNDGEEIWEKLVNRHSNFFLVFSGHVLHEGYGKLVSQTDQGNYVYQFLANYQRGVASYGEGCNGFMRLVEVDLKDRKIKMKTYSPWLEKFLEDENNQFEIPLKDE